MRAMFTAMGLAVLIALVGAGTAGASITISGPVTVDEPSAGTTDATFVITRAQTLALTGASVTVSTVDGSAVDGADYTGVSQTVSLPAGILGPTYATVTVQVKADTLDEANETFSAVLSNPTGGESLGSPSSATTTILDDPADVPPSVAAGTPAPATEGTGASTAFLSVPVTLSAASGRQVSVDYATGGGTATPGSDYTAVSGTLVFAPGQTTANVSIPVTADAVDEGDETVGLTLSSPVAATLGVPASVTGTIVDDDTASLSVTGASVSEGAAGASTPVSATVILSTPSAQPVSVHYATADGTAVAPADYVAASGTVTIPAGQTSAPIPLTVSGDALDEPDETFSVALDSPVGAAITAGGGAGTITILDDDAQPSLSIAPAAAVDEGTGPGTPSLSFPVTLSAPSGQQVQVAYATSGGSATADTDYTATSGTLTFAPGQTSKTITVPVLPDAVDESDETVQVTLSAPVAATITPPAAASGTIVDDDTSAISVTGASVAEGATGTTTPVNATVQLSVANDRAVSVHYATADGTAAAPGDYTAASGTVTIPAGQTSAPIPLTVVGDSLAEDDETFDVTLTAPVNAVLAGGGGASATLTILDDDTTPVLTVGAPTAVTEGTGGSGPTLTVPVTLSAPSGRQVRVDYATGGGTATPGADYTAVSGTLVVPAGAAGASVTIPVTPDAVDEGDETVGITFSAPVNATLADPAAVTGTILDDDTATVSVVGSSVTEGPAGATTPAGATVTLSTPSAQDITVGYATADGTATAGTDYVAQSGSVTIPAGQTAAPIALSVKGDSAIEGNETFTVTIDGGATATVTIVDDDAPVVDDRTATTTTTTTGGSTTGTRKPTTGIIPVPVGNVRLSALRFTRSTGTLRFVVSCPSGSGRCKGTLTILSVPDRHSKVRALRKEQRLALRRFNIVQHGTATVTLKLSSRTRSWLRTVHQLKISAYAVSKNSAGDVSSARRRGTLTG